MGINWCEICEQMRRFKLMFHVGKNENIGICKTCKTSYSEEKLKELWERCSMID